MYTAQEMILHVYLFDTNGSSESVELARELVRMRLPDVRVLPANAPGVRELLVADARVPLVPCVVTMDVKTGEWRDVYTKEFLLSHFVQPLRAALAPRSAAPEEEPSADMPIRRKDDARLSVTELAQRMMDERESDIKQSGRRALMA